MDYEEMLRQARRTYGRAERSTMDRQSLHGLSCVPEFPAPPDRVLPATDFVNRLLVVAFEASPKLSHPFTVRLARGEWSRAQMQEWVRQEYQHTVCAIRRHALVAANAPTYGEIWALITRVKAEADADPVGGVFFALPQLWVKFGISLGMAREEITESRPHPLLDLLNQSIVDEVRFSGVIPVSEFVNAFLDPIFSRVWGDALENSLHLPPGALDYFGAMAGTRWGEETGRSTFERWASTAESQTQLWSRFSAEPDRSREWQRFAILQQILERVH
ncbi:MAG: hypothetical protein HYX72_13230 [Acidobacteria bacterium]|nr:hypothetical protein [Acidobacteriota bacterium]